MLCRAKNTQFKPVVLLIGNIWARCRGRTNPSLAEAACVVVRELERLDAHLSILEYSVENAPLVLHAAYTTAVSVRSLRICTLAVLSQWHMLRARPMRPISFHDAKAACAQPSLCASACFTTYIVPQPPQLRLISALL